MALFNKENSSINNVISSGSSVTGNIKINGYIHIDGDLEGNLELREMLPLGKMQESEGTLPQNQ